MNFSKKIAAGAVALALGTSALVAPQARALPAEFVSPPGLNIGYTSGCKNTLSHSEETGQQSRNFEKSLSDGMEVGTRRTEGTDKVEFIVWASYSPKGERAVRYAQVGFDLRNVAKESTWYRIESLKNGSYTLAGNTSDGVSVKELNVTDTKSLSAPRGTLKPGESTLNEATGGALTAQLTFEEGRTQTYAWKVTVPFSKADRDKLANQVRPVFSVESEPWAIENDYCLPLLPSDNTTKPLLADGTEYDTGITVRNGAAEDYARLTGNVYDAERKIAGAKIRVDGEGKVYVTVPKGATGEVDDTKPKQLKVELVANPREDVESTYESYSQPQVLLVENPDYPGSTNGDQPKFSANLPVANFKPKYNDPNTVKPGKSVKIDLSNLNDKLRENKNAVIAGTTFSPKNPAGGWAANIADEATGQLEVYAPADAKNGDKVTVEVTVTYPDGSQDVLKPTVTVKVDDAVLYDPKYGEKKGKPETKVTLKQLTKGLPEGSTFILSKNQNLGDWKPVINPQTGEITVVIPEGAQPGDIQTILVDVAYPDGSVDKQRPAKVIVLNNPGYGEEIGKPGETVAVENTGPVVPGTTFEITPSQDLGKWEPRIDENSGKITVTIPDTAKPGDIQEIKVTVNDPKNPGKPDEVTAVVKVYDKPNYDDTLTPPGEVTVTPNTDGVPKGSTYTVTPGQDFGDWDVVVNPDGTINVVVPENAENGDNKTVNVTVTYPNGKTDEVPAKITVVVEEPAQPGEPTTTPEAPGTEEPAQPGEPTTTLEAPGTEETDKPGEPTTTLEAPGTEETDKPGEPTTTPVVPTEQGGGGNIIVIYPGGSVTVNPTITVDQPEGTTYKIQDGFKIPEGWKIEVDPKTGEITVSVPEGTKPGVTVVPIEVTTPDGKTTVREVPVVVQPKDGDGRIELPVIEGGERVVFVPVPAGTNGDPKAPNGWGATRDGDKIIVTVPENAKPGDYRLVVPTDKGDVNITLQVTDDGKVVQPGREVTNQAGSSEEMRKCLDNLAKSPVTYIVPAALLLALGAPLVGQMGPEIGKAIANVSAQMNIDIPNPFAGVGGERRQSPAAAQLQAEIARLQEQFGPAVTQIGAAALGLLALAGTAGILYAVCVGEDPELKSSNREGGSSAEGSSSDNEAAEPAKPAEPAEPKA